MTRKTRMRLRLAFNVISFIGILAIIYLFWSQLKEERSQTEATHHITENLAELVRAEQQAVIDLKADNEKQTVILCTLILGGNLKLDSEKEAEVEQICQEKIKQANGTTSSTPQAQPSTTPPQSSGPSKSSNPPPNNNGNDPDPPETPVRDALKKIVDDVQDGVETLQL